MKNKHKKKHKKKKKETIWDTRTIIAERRLRAYYL